MEIPAGKYCDDCQFFVEGPSDPYEGCDHCGLFPNEKLGWEEREPEPTGAG